MSMSDEDAAAEWKRAQGQVRSKTDIEHIKPALIIFPLTFAASFALAYFVGHLELAEALFIAPFCAILSTARILLRWRRIR